MITCENASDFVRDTLAELGPLNLGSHVPESEWAKMPALSVVAEFKNVKEVSGPSAAKGVPWLMAVNNWEPNWGEILKGSKQGVDSIIKSRQQCLLDLLRFIDMRFRMEVYGIGWVHDRTPANWWFYVLKGEFLRESTAIGSSLMPGNSAVYIDATYAFVRKEKPDAQADR